MNRNLLYVFLLLLVVFLLSLGVGSINIFSISTTQLQQILLELRLPRSLSITFVGMALGLSGFVLQSVLQNPLAEPYTLGISGGASIGVSIALLFAIYPLWLSLPLLAGIGCIALTAIIFLLAKKLGGWNQRSLILAGVILSYFCNSLSYVSISALSPNEVGTAIKWLMGRFGEERDTWWPLMAISFTMVYVFLYYKQKALEYYHLGENLSVSFIYKNKTRVYAILAVSLLAAITVVIAGVVAFVGLIAPHLCLYIFKTVRYKYMLPLTAMVGAILLLCSDIIGRVVFPLADIPAGGVIAILGTPFLLFLLTKGPNDSMGKI